ncbi:ComF family protein [Legionella yabuuchiae]|uniref:ComF family protein n=1 Tax=Legionella yabuuchiae TaxID=376727 RepID=UPI001F5F697C|nr:ComF family protein [Legionella yabuuchiae]
MELKKWSITQPIALPSICALCEHYHHKGPVCNECQRWLLTLGSSCQICALPLLEDTFSFCGRCIKQKPAFDNVSASYRYEEPLRILLHQFKYNEALYLNAFLADLMLQSPPINIKASECLIPVPMHPEKLRTRGFNQAAELTKYIAKTLNKPYDLRLCSKIVNTLSQAGLNQRDRQKNIKSSFYVRPNRYKHVTIIDDLLTTGWTAHELASQLKATGILTVDVWCCARAVMD